MKQVNKNGLYLEHVTSWVDTEYWVKKFYHGLHSSIKQNANEFWQLHNSSRSEKLLFIHSWLAWLVYIEAEKSFQPNTKKQIHYVFGFRTSFFILPMQYSNCSRVCTFLFYKWRNLQPHAIANSIVPIYFKNLKLKSITWLRLDLSTQSRVCEQLK